MPAGQHLFRRGAIYYWRKRLTTADNRTTILQVSLQTTSKERARRLGMELSWVSERLAIDLSSGRLTSDQVRAILRETARNQALCLENSAMLGRTAMIGSATRGVWGETVTGAAWRVLAEQGRAAKAPTDPDEIAAVGLDTSEAGLLDRLLDTFRSEKIIPPADASLDYLIKRHASGIEVNMLTLAQTEHAFYRGMAAAYLHTQPRWGCTLDDHLKTAIGDVAPARSTATEAGVTIERTTPALRPIDAHPDLVVSPSQSAAIENRPHHPDEPTIGALAERFGAVKIQLGEWSEKTARQVAQTAAFLVKVVGHDRFTRLTQADMGKYVDVLLSVPKTYGKSPRDAECSVAEILERGARLPAGQRGLSGSTINRHLTQLGELIAHAASRGHNPPAAISLTSLRTRKKTRDRDDRDAFTLDDLNSIFRQPVWAGCGGERRRWVVGDCVVHDGLYWAPLIAHYGLMRREEVCGLMIADVVLDTEVPNFDLRPNKYRALKNPQSKRRVPVHPELLRLGLADYIRAVGATIRNKNTRMAYYRAVCQFFAWAEHHKLGGIDDIEPLHVAAYIEAQLAGYEKPTVKQHLAAIRMLFDWLVTGQVLATNPAHAVRGPKHVVKRGKTTVLTGEQARELLDGIDTTALIGLRDRALISVMTFAFARVSAVVAMRVEDYYPQDKRWWVRLHEKGGKRHEMPAHHNLEAYLDAYIKAAGLRDAGKVPLFRSAAGRTGTLTAKAMNRVDAWRMVQRRALDVGQRINVGCHTFRATGITAYLEAGGSLENAQAMAAHESPRTTKLYDRTGDEITLDEVERISI